MENMAERKVTMRIYGMTCDDCVASVAGGLKEAGATGISVSLEDGMAVLTIDDSRVSPESLAHIPVFTGNSRYRSQIRRVD